MMLGGGGGGGASNFKRNQLTIISQAVWIEQPCVDKDDESLPYLRHRHRRQVRVDYYSHQMAFRQDMKYFSMKHIFLNSTSSSTVIINMWLIEYRTHTGSAQPCAF